ncbi:hypothetical protein HXX76_012273 [Chlamydomonas incerta]|uniref:4-alpha-glucanotransferase n=1 Tax=Chlamydomonas incerta TaxID=51695 RepID=A0A835SMA7_CHLIN|nr:hypothetical protein HXX76_012273 [Chlamydomonas incerta]|eukprot:KAG2427622.1 hypothetical protein HXX76_012273 [Chlamydomonas incerta]
MASAAFTKVLFSHKSLVRTGGLPPEDRCSPAPGETVVRLQVADFQLEDGEAVLVTGGIPQLGNWQPDQMCRLTGEGAGGNWQPDQMCRLTETHTPFWEAELRVPYSCFPFTYKYAIQTAEGLVLEVGEPRLACLPASASVGAPTVMVRHDGYFRRDRHWRGAGVAVPVFSLRSQHSVGVGEFLDLIPLVDLADKSGMRLIQVLPVNDTCVYGTWYDSYPYSTLSVHALHPQYLALRDLLAEEGQELPHDLAAELHKARRELDKPAVDYEATMTFKSAFVKKVYDRYGQGTLTSQAFADWFAENAHWLRPYAAFCFLRDIFQTAEHWRWGALSSGSDEVVDRLTRPGGEFYPRMQLTYYTQFHLHRQLLRASQYAAAKRVVLKGDLPIGVDKRSVDTWRAPQLFRMDKSTGAPPDAFSPTGQNWGFPTYDWAAMSADGFAWWRSRLAHLAQYFTAYRIDHVLGFFRIWEVPGDCVTGLLGYFRPSRPLTKSELEQRGVWDTERLVKPLITEAMLKQAFGERWEVVAATYMLEDGPGKYKLRPAYASECAIAAIPVRPDSPAWLAREVEETRAGLMRLRQNVVLLADPEDPEAFHPRFGLMSTSSYASLPAPWRATLRHMHDDYFYRRQEDVWRTSAMSKLPALQAATDMLVCGEDLGFVPACVPPVMKELGLLGLRIQRMATERDKEFNNPAAYPYLTVASPSCHDVTPLRAWFESDPERAERFYYHQLGGCGPPPPACGPNVVRAVLQQHINCQSMLTIFPIQDLMALSSEYAAQRPSREEVINDPTVAKHYWRFRIHTPLEALLADSDWLATIAEMLVLGERASPLVLMAMSLGGLAIMDGVAGAPGGGVAGPMAGAGGGVPVAGLVGAELGGGVAAMPPPAAYLPHYTAPQEGQGGAGGGAGGGGYVPGGAGAGSGPAAPDANGRAPPPMAPQSPVPVQ